MEQQMCPTLLQLEEKALKLKKVSAVGFRFVTEDGLVVDLILNRDINHFFLLQEMKNKEKELSYLKDQQLAKMEHQCHLLTSLNKLRCQQIAECEEKLDAFALELDTVKEELNMIYALLSGQETGLKVSTKQNFTCWLR